MTRDELECPVGACPWRYVLTSPVTEERGDRLVLAVPPPAGAESTELAPEELAAGVAASRRALADVLVVLGPGDPAGEVRRVGELVFQAAYAQDQAVLGAHLMVRHTRDELAAVLPPAALRQLDELAS